MKTAWLNRITVSVYLLLLSVNQLGAQESRLVHKIVHFTGGKTGVMLKWYSTELIHKEGCNVYRIDLSDKSTQKCNTNPIVPLINEKVEPDSEDSSMMILKEILVNQPELFKQGLLQLHLYVASFNSISMSKMLGIYYVDTIQEQEKRYIYCVKKLKSKQEYFLTQSDTVSVRDWKTARNISAFTCIQKKNKIELKWKPQDSIFYAVNVFRKDLISLRVLKRNEEPLMVSGIEDENGNDRFPDVFFTDTISIYNRKYEYFLKGIDFFGEECFFSDTVRIFVGDSIPPGLPAGIELKNKSTIINLCWKNPTDADFKGCNIFRSYNSDSLFFRINDEIIPSSLHQYTDTVPETGPWYYKISSVDFNENENTSQKLYVEVHDIEPPDIPSGLGLREDSGLIIVSWRKNKEKDLAGYLLYRSLVKQQELRSLLINSEPLKDTFYLDKNANSKNDIIYQLAAIDYSSNASKRTEPVYIQLKDRKAPVQPKISDINSQNNFIIIHWLQNPETDLAGYIIKRTAEKLPDITSKLSKGSISFIDTDLISGKYYEYVITAIDSAGNYSMPSASARIKAILNNLPEDCKSYSLNGKYHRKLKLSWEAKLNEELLGYAIFCIDTMDMYSRISPVIHDNEFAICDVIPGRNYQYQLRTYYKDGNVCLSKPFKIRIPTR